MKRYTIEFNEERHSIILSNEGFNVWELLGLFKYNISKIKKEIKIKDITDNVSSEYVEKERKKRNE